MKPIIYSKLSAPALNAEFEKFLTKLSKDLPNLKPGTVLEAPALEKERLQQEIRDKEARANQILAQIISWVKKVHKAGAKPSLIDKALALTLHPDKFNNASSNAKYLNDSLLYEKNKGFYFKNVKTVCQELDGNKQIEAQRKREAEQQKKEERRAIKKRERAVKASFGDFLSNGSEVYRKDRKERGVDINLDASDQTEEELMEEENKARQQERENFRRWQKTRSAQETRERAQKPEIKPSQGFFPDIISTYCEDVAFAWSLFKSHFFEILLWEALAMTVVLALMLVSTIVDIGLVLAFAMVIESASEISITSVISLGIIFPLSLPGVLAAFYTSEEQVFDRDPNFIDGYLYLLKIVITTPIAALTKLGIFIYSCFPKENLPEEEEETDQSEEDEDEAEQSAPPPKSQIKESLKHSPGKKRRPQTESSQDELEITIPKRKRP